MADGLGAGARGVEVGGLVRGEDGEGGCGEAFGGEVDVMARQGGGGGEEEGLGEGLDGWGGKGVREWEEGREGGGEGRGVDLGGLTLVMMSDFLSSFQREWKIMTIEHRTE